MKKNILFILISLQSCTGYQYISSPQFVPLHDKKNELKLNLSFRCAQIGYSISNKFGLFSTFDYWYGYYGSPRILYNSRSNKYETKDFNFGVCYYKKYNFLKLEFLVGGGSGIIRYADNKEYWPENLFSLKADKANYFIQPNLSYKQVDNKASIELGIFTKFICSQYRNIKTTAYVSRMAEVDLSKEYFKGKEIVNLFFIEPGFLLRGGMNLFKVQIIVSPTISLNNSHIKYKSFNLFFGLFFDFDSETIKDIGP